jgi:hypothetical protein
MTEAPVEMVEVAIRGLPVDLILRAMEHQSAITREFALIASQGADEHAVPLRLLSFATRFREDYSNISFGGRSILDAAVARGDSVVDFEVRVPRGMEQRIRELDAMLDEAEEYCRAGQLLTPPSDDVTAVRRWFLLQVAEQLDGEPIVAWPEWRRARG